MSTGLRCGWCKRVLDANAPQSTGICSACGEAFRKTFRKQPSFFSRSIASLTKVLSRLPRRLRRRLRNEMSLWGVQ